MNPALIGSGDLEANTTRQFDVLNRVGVPANGVAAVVVNIAVIPLSAHGRLYVWNPDTPKPEHATVHYQPNDWRGVHVTVPVSDLGRISVLSEGVKAAASIVVQGYYSTADGPLGSRFRGTDPANILDTRVGKNYPVAGAIYANTYTDVQVKGWGGVPAEATAVAVNLTATSESVGAIAVYPSDAPDSGQINTFFGASRPTSIMAIVRLPSGGPADGKIRVKVFNASAFVTGDVLGYYHGDKSTEAGRYTSITPTPVLVYGTGADGPFVPNSSRVIRPSTHPFPTFGVSAVNFNVTAIPDVAGFFTMYPADMGARPNGVVSLAYQPGNWWSNAMVSRVSISSSETLDRAVTVWSFGKTNASFVAYGYFTR